MFNKSEIYATIEKMTKSRTTRTIQQQDQDKLTESRSSSIDDVAGNRL